MDDLRIGRIARDLRHRLDLTARRRVERFGHLLGRAYPLRGRAVRAWLRAPREAVAGLIFLTAADGVRPGPRLGPVRRIPKTP